MVMLWLAGLPVTAASVYVLNSSNIVIPDAGDFVVSPIVIASAPANAIVTNVEAYFRCVHTYAWDLDIQLRADLTGSLGSYPLWYREGGSLKNPARTNFNITMFNGLSVNRVWYLFARDEAAAHTGYLDAWSIRVYYRVPIQPDLVGQGLAVSPSSGEAGSDLTVSFTIRNQGNLGAKASSAEIRLGSSSNAVSSSDPLLATVGVPALGIGASYAVNQTVTLPESAVPGLSYVWVLLDVEDTAGQEVKSRANDQINTPFTINPTIETFFLSFPLPNLRADTAAISCVFDHSMVTPYCPQGAVTAYTGESGILVDTNEPAVAGGCGPLYGYRKADASGFRVNGHYVGTPSSGTNTLSYEGHPGYDYPVPSGTAVLAAAPGVVVIADASDSGSRGNYVRIRHGSFGFQSQYEHLREVLVTTGQRVSRGQVLGRSGTTAGPGNTVPPHLHFEVRKLVGTDWVPADPYGWAGTGLDPYSFGQGASLWQSTPACSYALAPSSRSHGAAAEAGGFAVIASPGCTWAAVASTEWILINAGATGTGNGVVGYTLLANPNASARTGSIGVRGQVFTIGQSGVNAGAIYPRGVWMGPAGTGNYATGRGTNHITQIVLHTTETDVQSALARYQTAGQGISAHYLVGTNGVIWQVVRDTDTAYHAGNTNYDRRSVGIALEAWSNGNPAGDYSEQTEPQFNALADLVHWLSDHYAVPPDRAHLIGHNQVPSPGTTGCGATNQWGGCGNYYDPGAWWNWGRFMNALGRTPPYATLNVQTACAITTLPQADAPVIMLASPGQWFVGCDSAPGFYLVSLSGKGMAQDNLPSGGEFHWDGWIPASSVSAASAATQVEVGGVWPGRLSVRSSPSAGGTVLAKTTDGKRYVATGYTQVAEGRNWREVFLGAADGSLARGWAEDDYLGVIGSSGGPAVKFLSQGNRLVLSWPTNPPGFVLETAAGLPASGVWSQAPAAPVVVNGQNVVTNAATAGSGFYRLRKP
jgi:murein DD-endopeptidase MepM/ murein hydrolase activator NlpD/N-acetyl-anhydromuramyl-L-alanine amidase AmpD